MRPATCSRRRPRRHGQYMLKKKIMPLRSPDVLLKNFDRWPMGYIQKWPSADEALNCKNPKCVDGCPVNVHIPEFIAKVAEGKFDEAFGVITSTNSLPAICGSMPQRTSAGPVHPGHQGGEPVGIGRLEPGLWRTITMPTAIRAALACRESNGLGGCGRLRPANPACAGDLARKV